MAGRSAEKAWEIMGDVSTTINPKLEQRIATAHVYAQLAIAEAIEELARQVKYKPIGGK